MIAPPENTYIRFTKSRAEGMVKSATPSPVMSPRNAYPSRTPKNDEVGAAMLPGHRGQAGGASPSKIRSAEASGMYGMASLSAPVLRASQLPAAPPASCGRP